MTSADLLYEYRWAIAIALVGLFLLSRYINRRRRTRLEAARRLAAEPGEIRPVGPKEYDRARQKFYLTLVLLVVIITAAVLTYFG